MYIYILGRLSTAETPKTVRNPARNCRRSPQMQPASRPNLAQKHRTTSAYLRRAIPKDSVLVSTGFDDD